jgi:hypothetical protein
MLRSSTPSDLSYFTSPPLSCSPNHLLFDFSNPFVVAKNGNFNFWEAKQSGNLSTDIFKLAGSNFD